MRYIMQRFCIRILIALTLVAIAYSSALPRDIFEPGVTLEFYPPFVHAGIPATVRAVATLPRDASLVRNKVELYYVDERGNQVFIDYLYDDETHGDAIANDNMFANILNSQETQARNIKYKVIAYYGTVQKTSPVNYLVIKPNPNFESLWAGFVEKMVNQDLDGALLYFREKTRERYRKSYNKIGMPEISKAYLTARNLILKKIYMNEANLSFDITINSQNYVGRITFCFEDGAWRIDTIVF